MYLFVYWGCAFNGMCLEVRDYLKRVSSLLSPVTPGIKLNWSVMLDSSVFSQWDKSPAPLLFWLEENSVFGDSVLRPGRWVFSVNVQGLFTRDETSINPHPERKILASFWHGKSHYKVPSFFVVSRSWIPLGLYFYHWLNLMNVNGFPYCGR